MEDGLSLNSGAAQAILGTIEPGKEKTITVSVSCGIIQTESTFKKIAITITDQIKKKTWHDSVSILFLKGKVTFNIKAEKKVAGVIIHPNEQAYHFEGIYSSITIPYAEGDYLAVFSGATADTESLYSLGILTEANSKLTDFMDLGIYEPNDTEQEATIVTQNPFTAYLHKNDIDYYRININNENIINGIPRLRAPTLSGSVTKASGITTCYLSWDRVEGADGYLLTSDHSKIKSIFTSSLSYSFSMQVASDGYISFYVRAEDMWGRAGENSRIIKLYVY
jgi:hypothetical protein